MANPGAIDRHIVAGLKHEYTTIGDQGYARSADSLLAEFGLAHRNFRCQTPADIHTNDIVKKLNLIGSTDKSSLQSLLTSPGGNSPDDIHLDMWNSSVMTPTLFWRAPPAPISETMNNNARTPARTFSRKLARVQEINNGNLRRYYICGCCPRKPKKFETAEELM
ncbi:SAGA complex subunit Sgf29 [Purpureocillium lavendulum]|uniref:SAGA complex subunit Sgf29 n=1 Tax=Purpureocillium lavendulum TaxID=1247861 RepID=A0AB34FEX7_9HYPO|nr:SAGA complex subunit Sgf29 [Purpureocillium lavendulum]